MKKQGVGLGQECDRSSRVTGEKRVGRRTCRWQELQPKSSRGPLPSAGFAVK